tara:strand:- start:5846 stop:6589 length:744 start_codon:yes stop_codon:yes gene_type:complete
LKIRRIKSKIHRLYKNKQEYQKDSDAPLIPWREGKTGDWVVADDGQICEVLKDGILTNGNVRYIRTVIGSFICKDNVEMKGEMRKNIYSFSSKDLTARETVVERKEPTTKEFMFAKYVAQGMDLVESFLKAFPTDNVKHAEQQSRLLLKQDRIKNLIREEIDKIMNEAEITPLYLLEKMKEIVEKPDAKDSDKINVLKELIDVAGMKDKNTKQESITLFQGFSQEQLDAINRDDTKKLASAKREITQ